MLFRSDISIFVAFVLLCSIFVDFVSVIFGKSLSYFRTKCLTC